MRNLADVTSGLSKLDQLRDVLAIRIDHSADGPFGAANGFYHTAEGFAKRPLTSVTLALTTSHFI